MASFNKLREHIEHIFYDAHPDIDERIAYLEKMAGEQESYMKTSSIA